MKKIKRIAAFIFLSVVFISCSVNALISCGSVSTLNTDLGYVDVGGLNFGNLLLVDTVNKVLNGWKVISYDMNADVKTIESSATLINNIQSGLTVSLSGSGASNAISAGVNASLSKELNFHVVNYKRQDFANPVFVLEEAANQKVIDECKNPSRKGQVVMLITSVTNGDTSQIYLGTKRALDANASSQKIGKFDVNISYSCTGNYEKTGNQVNLFFRPQYFMCDPVQGLIDITGTRQFDLTHYSFVNAIVYPNNK